MGVYIFKNIFLKLRPRISKRVYPSVGLSVCPSVVLSVRPSVGDAFVNKENRYFRANNCSRRYTRRIACKHIIIQSFHHHEDASSALWDLSYSFQLSMNIGKFKIRIRLSWNQKTIFFFFFCVRVEWNLFCIWLFFDWNKKQGRKHRHKSKRALAWLINRQLPDEPIDYKRSTLSSHT